MKLIMYDFQCESCDHTFDDLVKSDVYTAPCEKCGAPSRRLVSAPRFDPRMGIDGTMPTMADKWARTRVQRAKIEREHADRNGEYPISTAGADIRR